MAGAPPRLFSVLIGINKYKDTRISALSGAVRDVERVKDFLTEYLGVPANRIVELLNEHATRRGILKTLRSLEKDNNIKKGDPILIYYAGHGAQAKSPIGWPTENNMIQMIVPYDARGKADPERGPISDEERGIPDRSMRVLLDRLADSKGDNLTVIYDCCYSGSGTRGHPRSTELPEDIPSDLDRDIWGYANRLAQPISGSAIESHVLLAACALDEVAYETSEGGVFTGALLNTIKRIGHDIATYSNIIDTLGQLPNQIPQCEGVHRDRILFGTKVTNPHRNYFKLEQRESGDLVIKAGSIHGITKGAEFEVFPRMNRTTGTSPLCTVVVRTLLAVESVVVTSEQVSLPGEVVAIQSKPGAGTVLNVFAEKPETKQVVNKALHAQSGDYSYSAIVLVDKKEISDLYLDLTSSTLTVSFTNPDTSHGLKQLPFRLDRSSDQIISVLHAAAHFLSHLRRFNPWRPFKDIKVNIFEIEETENEYGTVKELVGDNLNLDDTVVLDLIGTEKKACGIELVNNTHLSCYPYVFVFNGDLSIHKLYSPPLQGLGKEKPPLMANGGRFAIGSGAVDGYGIGFSLPPNQDHDVGFVKLFFSTRYVDLDSVIQKTPIHAVKVNPRHGTLQEVKLGVQWDTRLIRIIQRQKRV